MKQFIISFSLMLIAGLASAQVDSGSFMINANSSGLKFESSSLEVENSTQESDFREFEIDFAAGYTVIDNLPVGVRFFLNAGENNNTDFSTFAIGPWARYYFDTGDFKPFGEIALLFGNIENGSQDRSLFLFQIFAGGEYFITDQFSVGGKLGIGFGNSEFENSSTDIDIFEFNLGIGFSFFF